jgi:hypothetical protein
VPRLLGLRSLDEEARRAYTGRPRYTAVGSTGDNSTECDSGPFMGMIGFDIACVRTRSGPRIQGYLVNDLWKTISANNKRTDFALAA